MRFTSFLLGRFITALVVNPPERKLAKQTSVRYTALFFFREPTYHSFAAIDKKNVYMLIQEVLILHILEKLMCYK